MDRCKTGAFLKQLRKEKGLTQEQLAERFHVSAKTVSRWETGSNLPDVDMLITLADFYGLEIRELLDAQRKTEEAAPEPGDTLRKIAAYAVAEHRKTRLHWAWCALGVCLTLMICTLLFVGETRGLLYGIVPAAVCQRILLIAYGLAAALAVSYGKAHWFQEKPAKGPEVTVAATVASKEIRPGTQHAGRSKGGYSYVVRFQTEEGRLLELFAYEVEFGGLKPGMQGLLTYRDSYFIRFEEMKSLR